MHRHGREQSPSPQKGPSTGKWNDTCRMQPSCGDENEDRKHTVPFPKFWSLGPQTLESGRSVHHLPSFVTHGREMCEGYLACLSFSFFICRKKFQHLHHRVVGDTYATELSTLPHKKYTLQYTIISLFLWAKFLSEEPRNPMLVSNRPMWLLVSGCAWTEKANQIWSEIWLVCVIPSFKCPPCPVFGPSLMLTYLTSPFSREVGYSSS